MKRLLIMLIAGIFAAPTAIADEDQKLSPVEIDKVHSAISFKVKHFGISTVTGTFDDYSAQVWLDPSDMNTLKADVTVKVASVDTENTKRDEHLRSEDFFHVDDYPDMTFVSTGVSDVSEDGKLKLHGELTIRGTTIPITLDAEMTGPISIMGTQRMGFTATGEISRAEFGLTWNKIIEGASAVGDTVRLIIETEAFINPEDFSARMN